MTDKTPSIVTAEWLKERLGDPGIKVLDASWFLPSMGRSGKEEFQAARIPGSQFFDIDGIADRSRPLPHMVPSEAAFSAAATALGIEAADVLVIYDRLGTFSSPRAWWTWKIFGHDQVAVMTGGLPAWKEAGGDMSEEAVSEDSIGAPAAAAAAATEMAAYPAKLDKTLVKSMDEVKAALAAQAQVVDARSAGRFNGVEPEPRADLPSGHMPGSVNVPFTDLLEGGAPSGTFKSAQEMKAVFEGAGVDLGKEIVCTCGSGATGAVLSMAAFEITGKLNPIFDGSWMEWASTPGSEIIPEPAPMDS
eukprot:jgi/Ulvmu1/9340/UM050_0091.1